MKKMNYLYISYVLVNAILIIFLILKYNSKINMLEKDNKHITYLYNKTKYKQNPEKYADMIDVTFYIDGIYKVKIYYSMKNKISPFFTETNIYTNGYIHIYKKNVIIRNRFDGTGKRIELRYNDWE